MTNRRNLNETRFYFYGGTSITGPNCMSMLHNMNNKNNYLVPNFDMTRILKYFGIEHMVCVALLKFIYKQLRTNVCIL